MVILAPTIMHTGTRVLWRDILSDFAPANPDQYLENVIQADNIKVIGHVRDRGITKIRECADTGLPILSMMRHPARVMESFRVRDELPYFDEQWQHMRTLHRDFDCTFVHIDSDERDEQLVNISRLLGVNLSSDWAISVKNGCEKGNHDLPLTSDQLRPVPDWIMKFYEEITHAGS